MNERRHSREIRPQEGGTNHDVPFSSRIIDGRSMTPLTIVDMINRLRHPDGRVNSSHPAIKDVMKEAKRKKLDVGIAVKGLYAMVVWGKDLVEKIDKKKVVKVSAGTAITAATVGGVAMIALRRRKRSH